MPFGVYNKYGSNILFADSAQAENAILTLSALASGAGRYSAQFDRGAGSLPAWGEWRLNWSLTGTNVVNAVVEIYIAWGDGTYIDGGLGTTDAALTTSKRNNLKLAGFAYVDQTTTNTVMYASGGPIWMPARYITMGVWNGTTLPFQTSTSLHQLIVRPLYDEAQTP